MRLFLFYKYVYLYHFLDSAYKQYHTIFVFLTSLNMTVFRSIHVAANGIISFSLMGE